MTEIEIIYIYISTLKNNQERAHVPNNNGDNHGCLRAFSHLPCLPNS